MVGEAARRPPEPHDRVQEEVTGLRAATICFLVLALVACRGGEPAPPESPNDALSRARALLHPYDFGERFREGIAALRAIPTVDGVDKGVAMDAFLLRAEALTDLLLAARATGDPGLAETLEAATGWELEGDLSRPRNLQILAQDIQETFELVQRELGEADPRGARAARMAGFLRDIQAVVFVRKDRLIQTLADLETVFEGRYASRSALVRLGEVFRPGPRIWRDHVLITLGFPCPQAVSGLMAALCLLDPKAEIAGQCLLGEAKHDAGRRQAAGAILKARCGDLVGAGGDVQAGIRGWYVTQTETLRTADDPLAAWVRETRLETWAAGLDAVLMPAFALTQSD